MVLDLNSNVKGVEIEMINIWQVGVGHFHLLIHKPSYPVYSFIKFNVKRKNSVTESTLFFVFLRKSQKPIFG